MMRVTGRTAIATIFDDKTVLEVREKHSVFSCALLEGLNKADYDNSQFIEINELVSLVSKRVPGLW
jgi:hypothetical protein